MLYIDKVTLNEYWCQIWCLFTNLNDRFSYIHSIYALSSEFGTIYLRLQSWQVINSEMVSEHVNQMIDPLVSVFFKVLHYHLYTAGRWLTLASSAWTRVTQYMVYKMVLSMSSGKSLAFSVCKCKYRCKCRFIVYYPFYSLLLSIHTIVEGGGGNRAVKYNMLLAFQDFFVHFVSLFSALWLWTRLARVTRPASADQ